MGGTSGAHGLERTAAAHGGTLRCCRAHATLTPEAHPTYVTVAADERPFVRAVTVQRSLHVATRSYPRDANLAENTVRARGGAVTDAPPRLVRDFKYVSVYDVALEPTP